MPPYNLMKLVYMRISELGALPWQAPGEGPGAIAGGNGRLCAATRGDAGRHHGRSQANQGQRSPVQG